MKNVISKANLISLFILIAVIIGLLLPFIVNTEISFPKNYGEAFYDSFTPFDYVNLIFLGIPIFLVIIALVYSFVKNKREDTYLEDDFEVVLLIRKDI